MSKVIVCHPDDEAAVRRALDDLRDEIYETHPILRVNALAPRGQVLVLDPAECEPTP